MSELLPKPRNRRGVLSSYDFQRIKALPRREWESRDQREVEAYFVKHLRRPGSTATLRPVQTAALWEMHARKGLFVSARTGSGKCVDYASEIYDVATGKRRTAGEFGPLKVKSLQGDGPVRTQDAVAFPSGSKPCVRLVLADGAETVVSIDHPVLTQNGWQYASSIATGTLVATPRIIRQEAGETVTIASDDEVLFASYLLSDGGVSQSTTSFTNGTPSVVAEFLDVAERITGFRPQATQSSLKRAAAGVRCQDYSVRKAHAFRERWGLHGLAKAKRLPAEFWGLPDHQIALFLNRFWACDGYTTANGFEIVLASEKMIYDLKFLLLRLGIHSRKKYKRSSYTKGGVKREFDAWRLTITGGEAVTFGTRIGPVLGKEKASSGVTDRLRDIVRNSNVDVVPINGRMADSMAKEMGWSDTVRMMLRAGLMVGGDGWCSRSRFRNVIEALGYRGQRAWMAYADVIWTQAVSVVGVGERPVADLSVPATRNFVCDGIIVHNTLLSLLGFLALNSVRPLLVVPAALKEKTLRDAARYRKDWYIPHCRVMSYEILGLMQSENELNIQRPDVIIFDECHRLKNRAAARVKRLSAYLDANPETKVVAMSGTIAKRSIKDYAHIAGWCLGDGSPVPREFKSLVEWSSALDDETSISFDAEGDVKWWERDPDEKGPTLDPGVLLELCSPEELAEPDRLRGVRKAYRRRLTETPGVIATQEGALGVSLRISPLVVNDPAITAHVAQMKMTWERPDKVEIVDQLELWRHLRTMNCGFFYRWNPAPPDQWRRLRREWASVVREVLRTNRRGIMSAAMVERAILEGVYDDHPWGDELGMAGRTMRTVYEEWMREEPTFDAEKNKEAIWLSRATLDACKAWAAKNPGIIWVKFVEFGKALSAYTGLSYYAQQGLDQNGRFIEDHPKHTPMIASIDANSAGLNLQDGWNQNLIVSTPTTGMQMEQLQSRTHREGQLADEVTVDVLAAVPEIFADFDKACSDARRASDMEGQEQRLCYADITIPNAPDREALWR